MRHSRSTEFREALASSANADTGTSWTQIADDPNSAAVLAVRAAVLRAAWRKPVLDRQEFLEARCRDRLVLDLGCVAHATARMSSPDWLHARLAAAARRCVGLDVLPDGVQEMQRLGYEVFCHDLSEGPGPLADIAPFEVIIAGELIEHLGSLDLLFDAARSLLAADGELIITTPNPYAPHRVRAASRGIVWENVDHVSYAFPSGIAALCERSGLVLAEAMTTDDRARWGPKGHLKQLKRRVRGTRWMSVGFTTIGPSRDARVRAAIWDGSLCWLLPSRRQFAGETFIYVVRRARGGER